MISIPAFKKPMKIRSLATSRAGDFVAAAAFENSIEIWDLRTQSVVSRFGTFFGYGGKRLAIDQSGQTVVAGNYKRGVGRYEVATGRQIWHAKGFRGVQGCSLPDGDRVVVVNTTTSSFVLDLETGVRLDRVIGAKELSIHSDGSRMVERTWGFTYSDEDYSLKVKMDSFALLAAVKIGDSLVLSFVGGPLQRVRISDGVILWKKEEPDHHFLELSSLLAEGQIFGTYYNYQRSGQTLRRIDFETGNHEVVVSLNTMESAFAKEGSMLVSVDRSLYRTSDGVKVGEVSE